MVTQQSSTEARVDGEENQGRKVSWGQKSQRMIFRTHEAQH